MDHRPSPILNDEEQELLNDAPEECLRHVIEREALPLDLITASLSPRVAAAVRSIASRSSEARTRAPTWATARSRAALRCVSR